MSSSSTERSRSVDAVDSTAARMPPGDADVMRFMIATPSAVCGGSITIGRIRSSADVDGVGAKYAVIESAEPARVCSGSGASPA